MWLQAKFELFKMFELRLLLSKLLLYTLTVVDFLKIF